MTQHRPVVLSFSGHDPSGGAGIQADIETLISHQCHCCSVITALTEQDSSNVKKLIPQHAEDIIDQATTLLNDFPVKAIKIGLIGHYETALAIHSILLQHPHIPVILDPVLASGDGTSLANEKLIDCINEKLLPYTTVITPNSEEARILTQHSNINDCGKNLLDKGGDTVLITCTDEASTLVENKYFQKEGKTETFSWQRLAENYHGSGCTLASAIAALMAHGLDPFTAISEAQEYTWNSLHAAYHPGKGQHNPHRLFWMEGNI
ncbi:MAG: hydroxymethylpyrimidine/phosphomethylpyrimidine kinase [Methylococcales symbiont of Hymedesmia sp. n. MRB-2018]|nr:MAG: hydroxymethylpyrimidine/phosphomethylpyrimidine kinase [Methylococcales symbiont of Hymedesmia sp. n. MRB-2018]